MKFKRGDKSLADYRRRQEAYFKHLCASEPESEERAHKMNEWMRKNSPFEPHEQLRNLRRAFWH